MVRTNMGTRYIGKSGGEKLKPSKKIPVMKNMELPEEWVRVIREYSMPVCRLDWRRGSYIYRTADPLESNFRTEILMKMHDWRERNWSFENYIDSFNQLYDTYDVWKDTYHAYFHHDIVILMEGD